MFNFLTRVFFVILPFVTLISTQLQELETICSYQLNCKDCIQSNGCAWCTESQTCFSPANNHETLCPDQFVYYPETELMQEFDSRHNENSIWSNVMFGSSSSSSSKQDHHLNPIEIRLTMRPNTTFRFNFKYTTNEDFPVDLFYLVDSSKPDQESILDLFERGDVVREEIIKITSNFRLGFGTFGGDEFEHHLPLTQDSIMYSQEIKKQKYIEKDVKNFNLTYMSIMKALCDSKWRAVAKRILVVVTSKDYTSNAILPSNYTCHSDPHELEFHSDDSNQLNDLATKESVNIIFVVKNKNRDSYNHLSYKIQGSSVANLHDSSQLTDLLKEEYNKMTGSVEIRDNAPSFMNIAYSSACLSGFEEIPTNTCAGLKIGDDVLFIADITVKECPKLENDWNQEFMIRPVGINENVKIKLNLICDCSCMESKENLSKCNK